MKSWYRKKRFLLPIAFVAISAYGASVTDPAPVAARPPVHVAPTQPRTPVAAPIPTPKAEAPKAPIAAPKEAVAAPKTAETPNAAPEAAPAPKRDYVNVDGETVPSPRLAPTAPAGASARCRDGTYSFSKNRRGTCSHHKGVAEWL